MVMIRSGWNHPEEGNACFVRIQTNPATIFFNRPAASCLFALWRNRISAELRLLRSASRERREGTEPRLSSRLLVYLYFFRRSKFYLFVVFVCVVLCGIDKLACTVSRRIAKNVRM